MGISMVDCRVGTIVWVRRKNGSWWPGRIVEPPPSHRFTPRIGATPIKLLGRGRESSHVDWYNLEKSKRVKAFRCGEFDDCIQRAESSQGYPSADCSKYERREDAILYALELEKQELTKKHKRPGTSIEERVGSVYRAKRSRCVYLPAESNNFSERKVSHPQPLKVSPSAVGTDNSSIQSGSADRNTSSGSMDFKSSNCDSWNEKRDEAVKDVALLKSTELINSGSYNGQFGSVNSMEHDELSYLSDFSHKYQTAEGGGVHTWKPKRKLKIRNLNKMSGVTSDEQSYLILKNGTQNREDTLNSMAAFESFGSVYIGYENMKEAMLIDADITVQASYRGEHVPLVSLMSRLNGKAIVGHPIDIEAIHDGSSETALLKNDDCDIDLFDSGGSTLLRPVWRTSRRTPVCYVPSPEPSLSNQNTKMTLCAGERKQGVTGCDVKAAGQRDGLLKPEESKATRVTCVPVNHIFSKLLIAVGGVQT